MLSYWNTEVEDPWEAELNECKEALQEEYEIADETEEAEGNDEKTDRIDVRTMDEKLKKAVEAVRESYIYSDKEGNISAKIKCMCKIIVDTIEQNQEQIIKRAGSYSGVFYRYNGKIINVGWEPEEN